ncbi:MAG: ADP-ribosylglycohydrolase family protein [Candidatus Bathyarchaeia archaeon]
MNKIQLSRKMFQEKVYACWLGKNIGGTLGAPYELKKFVNDLDFYRPVPRKAAPNDDLDLQIIWLKMLEERGVDPSLEDFAEYWKRYASAYPWNEYGFLSRNLKRGLLPPISGCFENYFVDEMGSPIRSEIWACIAPGDPQLAASMAWKDAVIDHAGGEGMHGEMFWAAIESAAFVVQDPETLIQIGLSMIPLHSAISRAIREAVWCYKNDVSWAEARERVVTYYGHHQPCHAPQNHAFIILGWLYGKDFGDKLCKAVNCGYDTDCTGATLGALLGILGGTKSIPRKWASPVGEQIVLHKFTGRFDAPKTLNELTKRTVLLAEKVLKEKSDSVVLSDKNIIPNNVLSLLIRNEKALSVLDHDLQASTVLCGDIEVTLHYYGEPVIRPDFEKMLGVSCKKEGKVVEGTITLDVPEGWQVKQKDELMNQKRFIICASKIKNINTINVRISLSNELHEKKFVILGPNEAIGYPSGENVPTCPKCHAWQYACICVKKDDSIL